MEKCFSSALSVIAAEAHDVPRLSWAVLHALTGLPAGLCNPKGASRSTVGAHLFHHHFILQMWRARSRGGECLIEVPLSVS